MPSNGRDAPPILAEPDLRLAREAAASVARRFPTQVALDRDELLSDAALGLVEAHRTYDDGRGVPFRAWAWSTMRWRVVDGLRRRHGRRFERIETGSLDALLTADASRTDVVDASACVEERVQLREELRAVLELPAQERDVLLRRAAGSSDAETAAALEISRRRVAQITQRNRRGPSGRETAEDRPLSPPEVDTLRGAALGESAQETAARVGRATDTIKTHRRRVIAKLGARNMMNAVYVAASRRLI